MTDRAQSETLGFALVFTLMVLAIGLVYTSGSASLQDMRDVEQMNNAQRAFEVVADNVEDMTHRRAPSRATEIKLADAQLRVDDAIQVNVSSPESDFSVEYDVRPVVYDAGTGSSIVYSQGAVIRAQDDGGFVVRESTLLLNGSRTVIPIIQTRLVGPANVAGSTKVLIRTAVSERNLLFSNVTHANTVWLNVTSPRASIWKDHLEDRPDVSCEPLSGSTVSCQVTADHVHVMVVKIDVSLE